jgi:hypothetical protein
MSACFVQLILKGHYPAKSITPVSAALPSQNDSTPFHLSGNKLDEISSMRRYDNLLSSLHRTVAFRCCLKKISNFIGTIIFPESTGCG